MIKKITLLVAFWAITFGNAQNLVVGKTTDASSGNSALAVDENGGTRWESAFEDPSWWSVDLGSTYNIGRVVIAWEGAYASEYEIQISSDNVNWTTIYDEDAGSGGTDDLVVNGSGRYVRYYGTARATPWGHSFWEFEVYEALSPTIDATLTDLTVNGVTVDSFVAGTEVYNMELPAGTTVVPTLVATTTQSSPAFAVVTNALSLPGTSTVLVTAQDGTTTKTYTVNFTVDKENVALNKTATASSGNGDLAFDGILSTRWESDFSDPQWVYVDLEENYLVEGVHITWEGSYATDYVIEVSNDASSWSTVYTETSGDGGEDDISFTPVSAKYVRYYGTARALVYGHSFWELEVYGMSDTGATLSTMQFDELNFRVYPNPTEGKVSIDSESKILKIEVVDITGATLLKTTDSVFDISNFSNGVYIVRVETERGIKTKKLIKY